MIAMRQATILSVPMEDGAGTTGCALGPESLLTAGLAQTFERTGIRVTTQRTIIPETRKPFTLPGHAKNAATIRAWVRPLEQAVHSALTAGQTPVVLGGDHSLSMGSISGVARFARETKTPLFVLWLDAHGDFHTPATSHSGNMHGMPGAYLCGLPGFDNLLPSGRATISPERLFMYGVRDLDPEEASAIDTHLVRRFDMPTIREDGIVSTMETIVETVRRADGLLHVSFDIDLFDPNTAPGTGTPVSGGATRNDGFLIMDVLKHSGFVSSLDLVELNPRFDKTQKSARLFIEMAVRLLA